MQNQKIKKITWMINNVTRYIYSNSTLLTFTPLHLFDKSLVTLQTACCIIIISVLLVYQRLYKKKKTHIPIIKRNSDYDLITGPADK